MSAIFMMTTMDEFMMTTMDEFMMTTMDEFMMTTMDEFMKMYCKDYTFSHKINIENTWSCSFY
jgi:hypothetical protein